MTGPARAGPGSIRAAYSTSMTIGKRFHERCRASRVSRQRIQGKAMLATRVPSFRQFPAPFAPLHFSIGRVPRAGGSQRAGGTNRAQRFKWKSGISAGSRLAAGWGVRGSPGPEPRQGGSRRTARLSPFFQASIIAVVAVEFKKGASCPSSRNLFGPHERLRTSRPDDRLDDRLA
jgi:hypothetical protein